MSEKMKKVIALWNECCELEIADYESAMLWAKRLELTNHFESLSEKQQKTLIKTLGIETLNLNSSKNDPPAKKIREI